MRQELVGCQSSDVHLRFGMLGMVTRGMTITAARQLVVIKLSSPRILERLAVQTIPLQAYRVT